MIIDNLKIRTKLLVAFTIVLAFTIVVGIVAVTSIANINRQIGITNMANAVGDYADTAQAANLRFVYYKNADYVGESVSNLENVVSTLENTLATTKLSDENTEKSRQIIQVTTELIANTKKYLEIADERDSFYKKLADLEKQLVINIDSLLGIGVRFLENTERNRMIDKSGFERFLGNLDIKDNIHNLNQLAMKFQMAISADDKNAIAGEGAAVLDQIESSYKTLYSQMALEESRKLINQSLEELQEYREAMKSILDLTEEDTNTITLMREQILEIVGLAGEIKDYAQELVKSTTDRSVFTIIVSLIFILALSIIITIVITRSITAPLRRFIGFITDNLATGDLATDIREKDLKSRDEIGDAARGITILLEKLREVVSIMQDAASQVSSGSDQIAESSQQLSAGASEQAASMEEVSSSMEQLVSNIEQNSENATSADGIAKKLASDAKEGEQSVSNTVDAMRQIAEKIIVIDDIARNTNLLALNAAIEAARAGDAGKGFAVVASEVRKLAENSQKAASDISVIAKSSVETAERAGKIISEIIPDIQKTAELMQEIANASAEQNNGAQQINTALMQLDNVTQSNASASEELASMSRELSAQSEEVTNTVGFFRLKGQKPSKSAHDSGADRDSGKRKEVQAVSKKPQPNTATQGRTGESSRNQATSAPKKPEPASTIKKQEKPGNKDIDEDFTVEDGFREF